jgi:hypothetical protein
MPRGVPKSVPAQAVAPVAAPTSTKQISKKSSSSNKENVAPTSQPTSAPTKKRKVADVAEVLAPVVTEPARKKRAPLTEERKAELREKRAAKKLALSAATTSVETKKEAPSSPVVESAANIDPRELNAFLQDLSGFLKDLVQNGGHIQSNVDPNQVQWTDEDEDEDNMRGANNVLMFAHHPAFPNVRF